jgi:hypothetical protein
MRTQHALAITLHLFVSTHFMSRFVSAFVSRTAHGMIFIDVFHPLSKSRVEILRQKTIIHHVHSFSCSSNYGRARRPRTSSGNQTTITCQPPTLAASFHTCRSKESHQLDGCRWGAPWFQQAIYACHTRISDKFPRSKDRKQYESNQMEATTRRIHWQHCRSVYRIFGQPESTRQEETNPHKS